MEYRLFQTVSVWSGEGRLVRLISQSLGSVLSLDWNADATGLIAGSSNKTVTFLYAYNATAKEPDELCWEVVCFYFSFLSMSLNL